MASEKKQIGVYDCWSCGKEVPVKKTDSGKLMAPCPWCEFLHYANPSTKHHAKLLSMTRLDAAGATPTPRRSSNPFAGG